MFHVRALAPLAFGIVLAGSPALAQDEPASMPARISVNGQGQANAAPDMAMTRLTVLRAAPTAAAALKEANDAVEQVRAALPGFGVEARDLQTAGFQISPQYRYENRQDGTQAPPVITGYEVRNTLSVKVRDLARLGELLDRTVQLGVNEGGSIEFQIEDPSDLENEARREAVARAQATAQTLAEAAGSSLGRVVSIEDAPNDFSPLPPPMPGMRMMASDAAAKVPVEIGENTVSASVRIVYELQN